MRRDKGARRTRIYLYSTYICATIRMSPSLIFFPQLNFCVAELGITCLSFFTCFELVFSGRICYCGTSVVYAVDGILYVGRLRLQFDD